MDDIGAGLVMRARSFRVETNLNENESHYTHLFACINEEDDGYAVQIRLYNKARPEHVAWGEETTDTVETASMIVAALAAEFSILQPCIKIEIRMNNMTNGTRH
jgi:hypothetical protein